MELKLTQTVQKGGCAAKVAASELRNILKQVQFPEKHQELLVDGGLFDDAAIYKVTEDIALVQTLDFFTPIVDTPKVFGQVAAANALSDVYAMGGRPRTAMAILAFPLATFSSEIIVDVLQGACEKIKESGANLVGGHSIDDDSLKFGLSVTGYVHPKKVWSNAMAKPGDKIILTKGLGTGTLTAGLKKTDVAEADIHEAVQSMAQLNNVIDFISPQLLDAIHGATDVTGFGLTGHGMQMALASQVSFEIHANKIPRFTKAFEFLEKGYLTKAHRTNAQYTDANVDTTTLDPLTKLLVNDPQTSGGLLLTVSPSSAEEILMQINKNFPLAQIIGEVKKPQDRAIYFL